MNDKLQQKIREAEDDAAAETFEAKREEALQADRDRAHFILGGINIADRVAESLSSEAIKAMIKFQDERLYLALGFETFVDFLQNSEFARMTKQQFYDRKALLEKEGEPTFDLLTELGISIRKRKLLGKGNVELAGDKLIIREGDETTEIPIVNRAAIFDAITALADANADKSIKIQRQAETIDKQKTTIQNAHDDYDKLKASKIAETASQPHMVARVELGIAFRKLTEAAADLKPVERDQFRDQVLEDVAAWRTALAAAYATDTPRKRGPVELKSDDFAEALDAFIDEHVDLDNETELAQQL